MKKAKDGYRWVKGYRGTALRFMTFGEGCMAPVSHKLNADGYFRKRWSDGHEMFHRFLYRAKHGDIPDGYEVDHKCGFRACCNPNHLQAIPRTQHVVKTNQTRVLSRNIVGLLEVV